MKRQKSNSPASTSTSTLVDSISSILPCSEDEEGSRELARNSNIKEDSEEDNRTYLYARLTSSTRSTLAPDFTSLIEPEVCLVLTDMDPD
ncbi:uncharacterized protein RCO7_10876 [Rhynchosporium graminicola]|uniref:Uncharacterized protein n=1 Tax=Rhynchosporium graminicola TaxID=2792576 RepID=A0A1E1LB99_9HELO|nr:uncharacterized protein RCO7_10876 [Rhynchosporium commune]